MNDQQLLNKAFEAMKDGCYDEAIRYTNMMGFKQIAIKAHLLIIEHEQAIKRRNHETQALQ
jgi:hypothetical protein